MYIGSVSCYARRFGRGPAGGGVGVGGTLDTACGAVPSLSYSTSLQKYSAALRWV